MQDHPERAELIGEAHARPTLPARVPCIAVHEALLDGGQAGAVLAYLDRALPADSSADMAGAGAAAVHRILELPQGRMKWERHGEFSGYTILQDGLDGRLNWPEGRPGQRIAAVRIIVRPAVGPDLIPAADRHELEQTDCAASYVTGHKALVASNFRPSDDGFIEFRVWNATLTDRQLGRILRRLFEIETYRVMALLAFPVARALRPRLDRLEADLGDAIRRMGQTSLDAADVATEEAILATVSAAAQEAEQCLADSEFRFSAASAYSGLVSARLQELREERLDGFQRLSTFLTRRFNPAIDTVAAVRARLAAISQRIERASALLRTRIDLERQKNNQNLLASMDLRARIQAKLQETVETLSVVAITYYAFVLCSKVIDHFREQIPVPRAWQDPLLIALLLCLSFAITALVRRRIEKLAQTEGQTEGQSGGQSGAQRPAGGWD